MDYKEEISFENILATQLILEYIDKQIEKKIKALKFDRKIPAKVINVGTGVADIQILGSQQTITNVKIRDGLTLNVNDEVYITCINGSLNNIFIDVRK